LKTAFENANAMFVSNLKASEMLVEFFFSIEELVHVVVF
jgi:hypothetical protein